MKPPRGPSKEAAAARTSANVAWALAADGIQLLLGLAAFALLADSLGTAEFGVYSTVIAISTFAIPVFSFGAQQLLMIDMAAGERFTALWPRAIATVVAGGCCATAVAVVIVRPLVSDSLDVLSFVALFGSQTVFFAVAEFALVSTQAHQRLVIATVVRLSSGLIRLSTVVVFAMSGGASTAEWAVFAVISWALAAAVGLTIVQRFFGARPTGTYPSSSDLRRGIPFAVGSGSTFALDAADRPMLLRLSGEAEVGVYAAGYRLIQMATLPIGALVRATDADFFAAGAVGADDAKRLAKRMSVIAASYGTVVGGLIFLFAPLLPTIIGDEWSETTIVIRVLALLPLVKAFQIFAANALTGLGLQSKRNRALWYALMVNLALNAAFIPAYGWRAAAISTLVAETVMAAAMWIEVRRAGQGR